MKDKKPKRVLYVNYCLAMGGIETMIVGFVDALPKRQFEPSVAVFESGGILEEKIMSKGYKVFDLRKKEGLDIAMLWRFVRLLRKQKIDIVHTNNYSAWLYAALACLLSFRKIRVIHTEHSTVRGHKKRRYRIEKFLSKFTNGLVTVSEKVKQNMVDLCEIEGSKIQVITNGIDLNRFSSDIQSRNVLREEQGISSQSIIFGTVGRLVPVKDHVSLLRSFAKVCVKYINAKLFVVGDGPVRPELEVLTESLHLEGKVFLLGERHDIPELLSMLDIYVVSSLSEGMSISVLEAMSASLPVVATRVGGNPEIVTDGKNGVLVPSEDIDAMTGAMSYLLENENIRRKMANASRQRVENDFSSKAMLDQYQQLYVG